MTHMEQQMPHENRSVRARLLHALKEGIFAGAERLPAESELAALLGISRTQLRDSLASLEREGFITRRQGVGTGINRHVLSVENRMDIEVEFLDMVRQCGKTPGVAFVKPEMTACTAHAAEMLKIEEGEMVLKVSRLVTADGKPAIYCEDHVPYGLIKRPIAGADFNRPIFDFLSEFCGTEPSMDLTDVHAAAADASLAELLETERGAPLIYLDEVDYDIEGNPILYSAQYYIEGAVSHTVLRKKL